MYKFIYAKSVIHYNQWKLDFNLFGFHLKYIYWNKKKLLYIEKKIVVCCCSFLVYFVEEKTWIPKSCLPALNRKMSYIKMQKNGTPEKSTSFFMFFLQFLLIYVYRIRWFIRHYQSGCFVLVPHPSWNHPVYFLEVVCICYRIQMFH